MMDKTVAGLVRSVTLIAVEAAFLALVFSFVWRTFAAKSGSPPNLADVQVSAAGALAVALGAGYAVTLGVPPSDAGFPEKDKELPDLIKEVFTERLWLSVGVFAYMIAGFAACVAYGMNEAETPSVLRTIAVGFGGYVIAYIGMAYRQLK
jgi:hypothetical protein